MKYDAQIGDLKNQVANAKNILITLSSTTSVDELAGALALFLVLNSQGKEVSIVTEDSLKVSHSNLYGVGQVTNTLPKNIGGNFSITLEGVVASDGTVPALEKLDWYPQGQNLNLVFHVLSGQTFQPARVIPQYSGGGFSLIFTIGASSLNALGNIYSQNTQVFSGVTIVNIDNDSSNTQYGQVNIVDPGAGTISEMIAQIIPSLGVSLDPDSSSNILAGIYDATGNLTQRTGSDTFMSVGISMQAGGKVLSPAGIPTQAPQASVIPTQPVSVLPTPGPADFTPLNQVFGFPVKPETTYPPSDNFTVPPVVNDQNPPSVPSAEERPMGEYASSSSPEIATTPDPDWLTPKIYKGGNIN